MKLCWLHQKIIASRLDNGSPLPERVRRHVQACDRCRQVYESETAIARALSANPPEKNLPPSLHVSIMAAIYAEQEPPAPVRVEFVRWALPLAAAACMIFAAIFWLHRPVASSSHPSPVKVSPADVALKLDLPSRAQVNQWSAILDAPLEHENQLVVSDAAAALNSLKNSFLPDFDAETSPGGN